MNFGYVKVATYSNAVKVADIEYNLQSIKGGIDECVKAGVHLVAFPELCLTGATCGDLFYSKTLLSSARQALIEVAKYSVGKNLVVFLGLPIEKDGHIYNAVAGVCDGVVLGVVPKNFENVKKTYQDVQFSSLEKFCYLNLGDEEQFNAVPFSSNVIFADQKNQSLKVAVEFCSDLYSAYSPSTTCAINGARIIVSLGAECEYSGAPELRRNIISAQSKKTLTAYLYSNAGEGESTTDGVYSGQGIICESGKILCEKLPFEKGLNVADIDLCAIDYERAKTFSDCRLSEPIYVGFSIDTDYDCFRSYERLPFIKQGEEDFLINIQAHALKKRIEHTNSKNLVLGLSGGLDSTLALIVAERALKLLGRSTKDVITVTMPCFGTSSRTLDNSIKLAKASSTTLKKVDITKSVKRHLKDLKHPEDVHDAAYENAQARERTQVLMDMANMSGGIVIGTGDLSELALGFATFNGDHMSMYAVNGSVPKTLARHLVKYTADGAKGKKKAVLYDILDTPVSPELIPSKDKTIKQVTEDIVGPYVLHDFFLYNMIKRGFTPKKIYYAAVNTFKGEFDGQTILKWLKIFIRRFFNQQFKRSCMPDGVKVTEISLSPRTSFYMPSDAQAKLYLSELESL